jgi:outer membrane protein assembly factor BamB
MPVASNYTSKVRFAASVKNTKVELPSSIGNLTQSGIAGCGLSKNYAHIDYVELCTKCVYEPPPPPPPPLPPPPPPIWAKFRCDSKNTGLSPYPGPASSTLKWVYTPSVLYNIETSPAIASDGTIYIGNDGGKLLALNPDGTLKWSFDAEGQIRSSPAIGSDGTIYFGTETNGRVYAVNPDGSQKWFYQNVFGSIFSSSPAIGTDGTIYIGGGEGFLHAINPNGTAKWVFNTGSEIYSSPSIASDGTIYIISAFGNIFAITPEGATKWFFAMGSALPYTYSSPAIGPDGTVYATAPTKDDIGNVYPYLYAINPNGGLKWRFQIGSGGHSPAIGPDGTIYAGHVDGLHAINPDGTQKWFLSTGFGITSSLIIGSNGTIYIQYYHSTLAINPVTRAVIWEYNAGDALYASPAISSDGTMYFGTSDGRVISLQD